MDGARELVKSAPTLPLARASQGLRRRPGRPRKHRAGDNDGDITMVDPSQVRMNTVPRPEGAGAQIASGPLNGPLPRLLDRAGAARYLSVSLDVLDRLARRGLVRRRVLPGTRCIRFDVRDLNRFIESS